VKKQSTITNQTLYNRGSQHAGRMRPAAAYFVARDVQAVRAHDWYTSHRRSHAENAKERASDVTDNVKRHKRMQWRKQNIFMGGFHSVA